MRIPLAIYTAIDGYAWQSGTELSIEFLNKAKRMIGGKFPDSSCGELPFGNAVLVDGWLVVFRYHLARNMDFMGRSALYVVLGAIPREEASRVNVKELLELPTFATPTKPLPPMYVDYEGPVSEPCPLDFGQSFSTEVVFDEALPWLGNAVCPRPGGLSLASMPVGERTLRLRIAYEVLPRPVPQRPMPDRATEVTSPSVTSRSAATVSKEENEAGEGKPTFCRKDVSARGDAVIRARRLKLLVCLAVLGWLFAALFIVLLYVVILFRNQNERGLMDALRKARNEDSNADACLPSVGADRSPVGGLVSVTNAMRRVGCEAGESMVVSLPGGAKMEFVWCPAGEFIMGSPASERKWYKADDGTLHRVRLSRGFWIGRYEVTQAQWVSVMGENPSKFVGADHPVESVFWSKCREFCRNVGRGFRLPTEAEWEYACRAGTMTAFAGNGRFDDMAQCGGKHAKVGGKQPNAWGIFDMHGNVEEWCSDWYGSYPSADVTVDPIGPETGECRIVRGGAYLGTEGGRNCRSGCRNGVVPGACNEWTGFRIVCAPQEQAPWKPRQSMKTRREIGPVPEPLEYVPVLAKDESELRRQEAFPSVCPGLEVRTIARFVSEEAGRGGFTNGVPQMILNECVSVENRLDYLAKIDAIFAEYDRVADAANLSEAILESFGKKSSMRNNVIIKPTPSGYDEAVCLCSIHRLSSANGGKDRWMLRGEAWFWVGDRALELVDVAYCSTLEDAIRVARAESRCRLENWERRIRMHCEDVGKVKKHD